jgi:hypothetical protein
MQITQIFLFFRTPVSAKRTMIRAAHPHIWALKAFYTPWVKICVKKYQRKLFSIRNG